VTALTVVDILGFLVVFLVAILLVVARVVDGLRDVLGLLVVVVVVLLVVTGFLVVTCIMFLLGAVAGFFVAFVVFTGFNCFVGFSVAIVVFLFGPDSLLDSHSPGKEVEHCSPFSQAEQAGPCLYIWPFIKFPLGP